MVSTMTAVPASARMSLEASRRRLLIDSLGIMVSAGGFGLVYGLSARAAGFSPLEASAMLSLINISEPTRRS
jgi:predicted branched-subunit amino acid permease